MYSVYQNASAAYSYILEALKDHGNDVGNTLELLNISACIENPLDNIITHPNRKFNVKYAQAEWEWYLSGDRSIKKLKELYGKVPPIWKNVATDGMVMSNYGWQWNKNNQLSRVIDMLREDPNTRRAVITIHDQKEGDTYTLDHPCTESIQFIQRDNRLHMIVNMRSCDIVYGFCNDQYCFSKLQEMVSKELNISVGRYFHNSGSIHIYKHHYELF